MAASFFDTAWDFHAKWNVPPPMGTSRRSSPRARPEESHSGFPLVLHSADFAAYQGTTGLTI
jgi:hypothetical protein